MKEAVWDESASRWKLRVEDLTTIPSKIIEDDCDVLINASGFLNNWSWPKIPGIEDFKRPKIHSARWDATLEFKDRVVGIIGNGSSAIQVRSPVLVLSAQQITYDALRLFPNSRQVSFLLILKGRLRNFGNLTFLGQLRADAAQLKVFMRSPTWISPALGANPGLQFQHEHGDQHEISKKHEQFQFTKEEKEEFRNNPEGHLQFRRRIEAEFNILVDMFVLGSPTQLAMHQVMVEQMKSRLGPGHEELVSKLIPDWAPGCRRITPGDGYLETLVKPNVECIFGPIQRLTDSGLEMSDGKVHDVDVLVRPPTNMHAFVQN